MESISKAEFCRLVTENRTVFVGISPSGDEIATIRERITKRVGVPRYAICTSGMHLVFGVQKPSKENGFINDSHLYLADTKSTTISCFRDGDILVVKEMWFPEYFGFEPEVREKWLYYALEKGEN